MRQQGEREGVGGREPNHLPHLGGTSHLGYISPGTVRRQQQPPILPEERDDTQPYMTRPPFDLATSYAL